MNNFLISCILLVLIVVNVVASVEVDTSHGVVSGKILKTLIKKEKYYGFMGIPFAKPPVNDLRFLPPQPPEPWDGVLTASKEKPACVQFGHNVKKGQRIGHYGVEDCLYLDIFTPGLDDSKRAVIVFLYNEQFRTSYNKTKEYAPDFFIEEDIVVVTISHRLSVFGFLSTEDDVLTGNAGLHDIVAGLQWVSDNIERFGGDQKRITLMGSQGGAAAIDLLIRTKARALFNSAILQSGTSLSPMYLQDDVRERAFKLGKLLERSTSRSEQLLRELNEISPIDLLEKELRAIHDDYFKETQRNLLTFGPIVEKEPNGLITEYPEKWTGKIDLPVMIGFNSREGLEPSLEYLLEPMYLSYVEKDFPLLMPLRLEFRFDPIQDGFMEAVDDIKKFYFINGKVKIKSVPEYVTFLGDVLTAYGVNHMVKIYSKTSLSDVYYYHFDYYSDLNENKNNIMKLSKVEDGTWGSATGDELCYLFRCPALNNNYLKHYDDVSEEYMVHRKLIQMWSNFAKYGNPTPDEKNPLRFTKWSPYNIETKNYLNIDKQIEIKQDPYKQRFQFWDNYIEKWAKRANNGVITDGKYMKDEL